MIQFLRPNPRILRMQRLQLLIRIACFPPLLTFLIAAIPNVITHMTAIFLPLHVKFDLLLQPRFRGVIRARGFGFH